MSHSPADFADFAESLADIARPIATRYFSRRLAVELKADQSPVTQADREIEFEIRAAILSTYADHGILGEEQPSHKPDADWLWVIDPIDGTRAFIAGKASFATLIGLCYKGEPVLGIIDQPVKRERWVGIAGEPTSFNGNIVKASDCATLGEAMISTTSIPYFTASEAVTFRKLEHATRSTLLNHDGYAYGLLASGDLDCVIEAGLKVHDVCALIPVVEGAGGLFTDWQGQKVNIHASKQTLASANKTLHKATLDLLNNHSDH